ncbi:MAG: HAD family hydrolase [Cyanobacteria bacterium P01_C01_bin.120]
MHLLFDLDGTLTNPQQGITACIQHAFRELGEPVPDAATLTGWIGPPLQESFLTVLGDRDRATRAVQFYRDRFSTIGLYENQVYAGLPAILADLRQAGHQLWVCTSKPQIFAHKIVEHFALAPLFQGVYGSELTGDRAYKTDLIAYVLQSERILPEAAVMIGDRHHDIHGALQNGLRAIGVTWGFGSVAELKQAGADRLCRRPADLAGSLRLL